MTTSLRRPPRWSKKTDELVHYVGRRCNQDKVRKKLNSSDDEEHRLDVRAELRVAYLIVGDAAFAIGTYAVPDI